MRGSMRQRGRSWELRVFLGLEPASGKKLYATKTVRAGKREAQQALAEMVTHAADGRLSVARASVGELLEEWYARANPDFSPSTALGTRRILDRHLLPTFGALPLRRLRAKDLDDFYAKLRAGEGTAARPLKASTIRRIHGVLHVALQQGVRWGWLPANPASSATPPRVIPTDIKPPSPAELGRLFKEALSFAPDLATYVVVASATGARRSEVIALRWRDLDLEAGRVEISHGIVLGPDGVVEKDTKVHAARTVSIDATTRALLNSHRERMTDRAVSCGTVLDDAAFVFSDSADGTGSWRPDSASRRFTRLRERCGLPKLRLHDLRHYVATTMLTSGVDARPAHRGRAHHDVAVVTTGGARAQR